MHENDDHEQQLLEEELGGSEEERWFDIGHYDTNRSKFCNNEVTTSKYTFFVLGPKFFILKNLLEQFQRHANKYFLVVAMLQLIPGLSPTGKYTTLFPLSCVLVVSLMKDTYEDWKRHQRDKATNAQKCHVWRDREWKDLLWRDICVGDIMKVMKEQEFPADLVLLYSTGDKGICHIETSNLDGETNLKIRKSHREATSAGSPLPNFDPERPGDYEGKVACKPPDEEYVVKCESFLVLV